MKKNRNHPYHGEKNKNEDEPVTQSRVKMSVVTLSSLIYAVMTGVALLIMWFWHENIQSSFALPAAPREIARLGAISILGIGVLLIASHMFEDWFSSYRRLRNLIMRLLGGISIPGAIYLSIVSAVGEELLFRGAIQPFAGIFLTSIMFGLLHVGPDGKISAWSLWTMLAGVLLGLMYEQTGSILAPMITHFGVNAYSLLRLRKHYNRFLDGVSVQLGGESDLPDSLRQGIKSKAALGHGQPDINSDEDEDNSNTPDQK